MLICYLFCEAFLNLPWKKGFGLWILFVSLVISSSLWLNEAQINLNWLKGRVMNFRHLTFFFFYCFLSYMCLKYLERRKSSLGCNTLIERVLVGMMERLFWISGYWGWFQLGWAWGWMLREVWHLHWQRGQGMSSRESSMSRRQRWGPMWNNTVCLETEPLGFRLHPVEHVTV